ncbi:MAG: hypothetical protein ACPLPW_08625 [bacterium]
MSISRVRVGRCAACGKELLLSRITGKPPIFEVEGKYYCFRCYLKLLARRAKTGN